MGQSWDLQLKKRKTLESDASRGGQEVLPQRELWPRRKVSLETRRDLRRCHRSVMLAKSAQENRSRKTRRRWMLRKKRSRQSRQEKIHRYLKERKLIHLHKETNQATLKEATLTRDSLAEDWDKSQTNQKNRLRPLVHLISEAAKRNQKQMAALLTLEAQNHQSRKRWPKQLVVL